MRHALFFTVVLGALASVTHGASCEEYEETLSDGSLGFCAGLIDYEYYLPTGATQEILELAAVGGLTGGSAVAGQLLTLLPFPCSSQLKKLVCQSTFPRCAVLPELVAQGSGVFEATNEADCEATTDFAFDQATGLCGFAVPRFPCQSECLASTISTTSADGAGKLSADSVCPLISGRFLDTLVALRDDGSQPIRAAQALAVLTAKGCGGAGAGDGGCSPLDFTFNLLELFGFAPDCEAGDTLAVAPALVLERLPAADQAALKTLVDDGIANELSNDCTPAGSPITVDCDVLREVYQCTQAPQTLFVERGFGVDDGASVCSAVLRDEANQDAQVNHNLASVDASFQLAAGLGAAQSEVCRKSGKEKVYKGAYFVPGFPGSQLLGLRVDGGGTERQLGTADAQSCPFQWEAPSNFANHEAASPLCTSARDPNVKGFNSRDCLLLTVADKNGQFPSFVPARCGAAFTEFLCAQAQMKLEAKTLCVSASGCVLDDEDAAITTDSVAFEFALPRFPGKTICEKVETECTPILAALGVAFDADCDGSILIEECNNDDLVFWDTCESAFNGLAKFPDVEATLFNPAAVPVLIGAMVAAGLSGAELTAPFTTAVTQPSVTLPLFDAELSTEDAQTLSDEFCGCPVPLVAPNDVTFEGIIGGTCCAVPCTGTMLSTRLMTALGYVQLVASLTGVLLSGFLVVTWGIFEEKQKQYMTFWIAICSFNVSAAFLAMALSAEGLDMTDALCFDNTTPNNMEQDFSLAVFQGIWLVYWALALDSWWLMQAIDLFRKLVLSKRNTEASRRKYHLFAWIFPLFPTIGLLVTKNYGFSQPTPWSFISGGAAAEFGGFYAFVFIFLIVGCVCMFSVLAVIFKHTQRQAAMDQSSSGARKRRQRWKMYRTPMLFVLAFILVWFSLTAFRALNELRVDEYTEAGTAWVQCLLGNAGAGIADPANDPNANTAVLGDFDDGRDACGITQPGGVNVGSLVYTFLLVMMQSHIIFLIYGFNGDNYRLWGEKFGCSDPANRPKKKFLSSGDDSFSKGGSQQTMTGGQMGSYNVASTNYPSSAYADAPAPRGNPNSYYGGSAAAPSPPPGYGRATPTPRGSQFY